MIGIIPSAGKGTRFKELGKVYSKTILPFKEKPILIHQIEWMEQMGVDDIRVILHHRSESVERMIKMFEKKVHLYYQKDTSGLSSAILTGLKENENNSVLISLGDILPQESINEQYFESDFISVKSVQDFSRWCMVEKKQQNVVFYDKPSSRPPTNLAVSGVYFFKDSSLLYKNLETQIKNNIKINGEYQLSTILTLYNTELIDLKLKDFGTLEEYIKNKDVSKSRSFNIITDNGTTITKESVVHAEKIIQELNWYKNIPTDLKIYTPTIYSSLLYENTSSYTMKKIQHHTLRELYLYLDSTIETWEIIIDKLFELLEKKRKYGKPNNFSQYVYNKTVQRAKSIDTNIIEVNSDVVNDFLKTFKEHICEGRNTLMHGDFCFSNLFFDFTNEDIIMIDPRGEMFGNDYYEVAKLAHSILWDYDFIDVELYSVRNKNVHIYNDGKQSIKKYFIQKIKSLYSEDEIEYIILLAGSLFLSMIPLHDHNKTNQQLYYKIFTNIYECFKKKNCLEF